LTKKQKRGRLSGNQKKEDGEKMKRKITAFTFLVLFFLAAALPAKGGEIIQVRKRNGNIIRFEVSSDIFINVGDTILLGEKYRKYSQMDFGPGPLLADPEEGFFAAEIGRTEFYLKSAEDRIGIPHKVVIRD